VRNIFLFIRRYFNFLFFLLLQVFSIYLIVHYSRYHKAMFTATANEVTGVINEQYNKIEYYFHYKQANESLVKANEQMYNKLKGDFELPDTSSKTMVDSINVDSLEQYRKYRYFSAKVVANSVAGQNNYIVLSRGAAQDLKEGMGIIEPNSGVVGIVTNVSPNYAVVMSLLHKDSHINGKLMHRGETGTMSWDGKTPNILTLSGIPQSVKVAKGDTIITSGYSTTFPKGMLIGYVEEVIAEKSTNNYSIKLRSAANFYNLEFVYAIDNKQAKEINSLLDSTKKRIQ